LGQYLENAADSEAVTYFEDGFLVI